MREEHWLPVVGYEGKYEVSSLGRVRSVDHYVNSKNGSKRLVRGRILKQTKSGKYKCVDLGHNNKWLVHRLVAIAFIPNPLNLPCVNHKNENTEDNCVDNLEWCTYAYNVNYGTRTERQIKSQINHPGLSKPVYCIETRITYPSVNEAWRKTGIYHGDIRQCCSGERKSAGKFHWKYV